MPRLLNSIALLLLAACLRNCGTSGAPAAAPEELEEWTEEDEAHEKWVNETLTGAWLQGLAPTSPEGRARRLEEKNDGNTKRQCVRALARMHKAEFKMKLPKSDRAVYMPCMSCYPTR